jgi:hypothetical protein
LGRFIEEKNLRVGPEFALWFLFANLQSKAFFMDIRASLGLEEVQDLSGRATLYVASTATSVEFSAWTYSSPFTR